MKGGWPWTAVYNILLMKALTLTSYISDLIAENNKSKKSSINEEDRILGFYN